MNRPFYRLIASLTIIALVAIIQGCSNDSVVITNSSGTPASVDKYFPLSPGSSVDYTITNYLIHDTTHLNCTVGSAVTHNGAISLPWLTQYEEYPSVKDTGYFHVDGNAVYYLENGAYSPEKILETPLEVGRSWQRFTPTENDKDTGNLINILTNHDEKGDSGAVGIDQDDNNDDIKSITPGKNYPTTGANYFIITAVEDVTLADGNMYRDCIRVENRSGDFINYYWYAPEAGLVKFANNIKPGEYPDGQVNGEIAAKKPF